MTGAGTEFRSATAIILAGLLTACAAPATRTIAPDVVSASAPAREAPTPVDAPVLETRPEADPPGPELWLRLGAGFRFVDCTTRAAVAEEARRYTAGGRFASMIEPMLPRMIFVLDEVERRGLPTEFVLLPIVESHYRPVAARGNQPAGPWQLMPGTARQHGLSISADYDARLDLAASTRAALDLVERLADRFGDDWVAVVKAYNAGEYRVLRVRERGGLDAARRGLSATTLTHHARLQALACIVRDPERYSVDLPPAPRGPPLAAHVVEAELDLDLAAAVAGMDLRALAAANPAIRGERAPPGSHLVMPADRIALLEAGLALVPMDRRAHWSPRDAGSSNWDALAAIAGIEAPALAAANGASVEGPVPARVVMPGHAGAGATTTRSTDDVYVVRKGDSAWAIAKRLRVRLADLLAINGLDTGAVLRPGQKLRLP
jgi:membrane-bound lytic murein transglycosylase D